MLSPQDFDHIRTITEYRKGWPYYVVEAEGMKRGHGASPELAMQNFTRANALSKTAPQRLIPLAA